MRSPRRSHVVQVTYNTRHPDGLLLGLGRGKRRGLIVLPIVLNAFLSHESLFPVSINTPSGNPSKGRSGGGRYLSGFLGIFGNLGCAGVGLGANITAGAGLLAPPVSVLVTDVGFKIRFAPVRITLVIPFTIVWATFPTPRRTRLKIIPFSSMFITGLFPA